jgi:hypothetical protein
MQPASRAAHTRLASHSSCVPEASSETARELLPAGEDCLRPDSQAWDQKEALTYIQREPCEHPYSRIHPPGRI